MKKLILVLVLLLVGSVAQAKTDVVLSSDVYYYRSSFNDLQFDQEEERRLWQMVREAVTRQSLPFNLISDTSASRAGGLHQEADSERIYLLPVVMLSASMDSSYGRQGDRLYNSTVIAGITLAFAKLEENYNLGTAGGTTYRLLAAIPLVDGDTIGLVKFDNGRATNKRHTEISVYEKKRLFFTLVQNMLQKKFNFANANRILSQDVSKYTHDTYQVVGVDFSSPNARELFASPKSAQIVKYLIASYYTTAFQEKNHKIAFPPSIAGTGLVNSIVDGMTTYSLGSHTGEIILEVPTVQNTVTLDVTGLNSKRDGYYVVDKVWLKKNRRYGSEQQELSRASSRMLIAGEGIEFEIEQRNVFARLLIGLSQDLGSQKI